MGKSVVQSNVRGGVAALWCGDEHGLRVAIGRNKWARGLEIQISSEFETVTIFYAGVQSAGENETKTVKISNRKCRDRGGGGAKQK